MKKTLLGTPLFILLTLFACKDDTNKLLKNIAGRWTVTNITYTNQAGKDSVVTANAVTLEFDVCDKSTNGSGPGNCNLFYSQNSQRFNFTYQATDGDKTLYINPKNPDNDPVFQRIAQMVTGSHSIVSLTETALILRRKDGCLQQAGGELCNYVKLSATR